MKSMLMASVLLLAGCASSPPPSAENEKLRVRNEGYSLLYTLVSDESDVNKILTFKQADPEISSEIKAIAHDCAQAKQQMDAFAKNKSARLAFNESHLPAIEQRTRDAEDKTESKALLLSSGKKFERELLLTQVQALRYASHLAGQIAGKEDDPTRKAFLEKFAQQCEQHRRRAIDLLAPL